MIEYLRGDIFMSPAQVIVNTVNTVGVMGKGIALEYKKRYPDMFVEYKKACENKDLKCGKLMLWYGSDHWILLFPTKEHWRGSSKMEYIRLGLEAFRQHYADYNITSIAFPKLGCGNGGLKWEDVKLVMEEYLTDLPIDVYVYLSSVEDKNGSVEEETKSMLYADVKSDIIQKTSIVPMTIIISDRKWDAFYNFKTNELKFLSEDGEEEYINDDDLHDAWDEAMVKKVISVVPDSPNELYYNLLRSMGYMTKVNIERQNSDLVLNGFQVNSGMGRNYMVKA